VERRRADDFAGIERGAFDVVVLSSVVQYLASRRQLERVLAGAIEAAAPRGAVFVGDVRSLPCHWALAASVALRRAPEGASSASVLWSARRRVREERELLIDPALFEELAARHPRIGGVELQLKRGGYLNELSKFRYDAVLHLGPRRAAGRAVERDWRLEGLSVPALEGWLGRDAPEIALLSDVPNARIGREGRLVELLREPERAPTAGAIRSAMEAPADDGLDPELFWALGDRLGYRVEVRPAASGACACFDVVLDRGGPPAPPLEPAVAPEAPQALAIPAWATNEPLAGRPGPALVQALRERLGALLPSYMVPAPIVLCDELPRTPNGKIDRRALPDPSSMVELRRDLVPPRDAVEAALAEVYGELLGVERVSAHDDFFALGGHSLLATQVVARVAKLFEISLPVRALFEAPTVAGLAQRIQALSARGTRPLAPIPRLDRGGSLPLSFAQERLWFLQQLTPETPSYNQPAAVELEGELDVEAMRAALRGLVGRQEVLRMRLPASGGRPFGVVEAELALEVPLVDLSGLEPAARERELVALARADAEQPFVLERGPLVRAALVRLGPLRHVLLLCFHHAVADGWSHGVVVRELGAHYAAAVRGRAPELVELPCQYADYAAWQRAEASTERLRAELAYWTQRLAGAPPALELPTDRPRPRVQTHRGGRTSRRLGRELVGAMRALGRAEGATPFMTLLAAVAALLGRSAGEREICIGVPHANRSRTDVEALVGCFLNTLVLRVDLRGRPSFRALVARAKEVALGAFAHQELPIERLVDALEPERDLSRTPLFQVVLALHNTPMPPLDLPGLRVRMLEPMAEVWFADADLTFDCWEEEEGMLVACTFSAALFEPATVDRLLEQLERLLARATAAPDEPADAIDLGSPAEWAALHAVNDTARAVPAESVVERIAARARQRPEAPALVFEGRAVGRADLDRMARRVAGRLAALGVPRGACVGILAERSVEMVAAVLGALYASTAYVPLEPEHPAERLGWQARDARLDAVLCQERFAGVAGALGAPIALLEPLLAEGGDELSAPRPVGGEEPCYVLYTSGSTGRPKGAVNAHRGLANRLAWMQERYPLAEGDRVLHKTPLGFDVSVWELLWPLLEGAVLVVAPPGAHRDPHALVELIDRERVTVAHFVPSMLRAFVAALERRACPSLRRVIASGEALDAALALGLAARSSAELVNLYGPTEAAIDVSAFDVEAPVRGAAVPIGRPVANTTLHVLDALLRPAPLGLPGELYIGGVQLAHGYLGRPELTAERFVPDPFGPPGARLYRTGDRARWLPALELEFLGRLDFQVKLRGHRIELGEIESVLRERPEVADAAVALRDGPAGPELCAYVTARAGAVVDAAELRRALAARLPEPMVPASVTELARLPTTTSGKLDRRALPAPAAPDASGAYAEPSGPVERVLAAMSGELLGVARVGRHDGFFALGGHSLLATQLLARVEDAFGVRVPLLTLFDRPTVASLAEALGERAPAAALEATAEVLLEIGSLSDAEVRLRLGEP
jgi:amino acid adenylation domain-containing protein